jgi:hypothetical protein
LKSGREEFRTNMAMVSPGMDEVLRLVESVLADQMTAGFGVRVSGGIPQSALPASIRSSTSSGEPAR